MTTTASRVACFSGYHPRFAAALDRARQEPARITGAARESAHQVWCELPEDLPADAKTEATERGQNWQSGGDWLGFPETPPNDLHYACPHTEGLP